MKNLFLVILAFLLNITVCVSQEEGSSTGGIGCMLQVSSDNQFIKVNRVFQGSPADIAGLKAGDHIIGIDGVSVREIKNPINHIKGTPGTYVKIAIGRYGRAGTLELNIPRISVPLSDGSNYITEGELTTRIYTNDYSEHRQMVQSSMAVLDDDDINIFNYRSYDFEYTSAQDPLLEKELFKKLADQLTSRGLRRSQNNPDILIVMSFYSGSKEHYNPPQQIISTRISTAFDWYWGFVPVPITETTTQNGYTEVTYLYTISMKFLDAHKIGQSKLPPVIWSGSVSQASKVKNNLVDKCGDMFALLLYQFPTVWIPNSEYYLLLHYSFTGIIYDLNNMRTVADVIPGSPAAVAGIQKGDEILNIFSSKIPDKYSDAGPAQWTYLLHGNNNGLRYLFIMSNLKYKPYLQKDLKTVSFVIKHKGERMKVSVTPQDRLYVSLVKN
jgi:membrane-associated protease RseP (regulator of RpoE activity)